LPGWRTTRKIIVIESDDWGSIRMASPESYRFFLESGYPVDKCHYNRYDALESDDDLSGLFEVLAAVTDSNGNHPILTANYIVANPDFEKIRNNNFQYYQYETFVESFKRYPKHANSFAISKEGIKAKVFMPQSHGREHLNVHRWMKALQDHEKDTRLAFNHDMFTLHTSLKSWNKGEYMDAFKFSSEEEKEKMADIVSEGISVFQKIWDFSPLSSMAPSYIWFDDLEKRLAEMGVKYLQGNYFQLKPAMDNKGYTKKYHYQGQRNKSGQRYLIRNAFFEPSQDQNIDWVNHCMKSISNAFYLKKPAIIQSHRVNYIGFIDPPNRSRNLRLLKQLLSEILKRWPDVEFMTSLQLGELMNIQK
jgi:hypothetical protein